MYPLWVCKNNSMFTFKNCRFNGGSNNAARYALFDSLKIPLIYTVESSFYGYQIDDFRIVQYLPNDYKSMGASLMQGFFNYEMKKNGKYLRLINITCFDINSDK
jgi:gentisate 1,2-dioxygenase